MKRKGPAFAKQHPAKKLRRLLGTWHEVATFPNGEVITGTVTFRWLEKDALMVMKGKMRRLIPSSISVLGADDVLDQLTMLYADERGVTRTYAMTLTASKWTWHRKAPRFHQRFIGRFKGRKIIAVTEKSATGRRWEKDFDIVYTKQR